MRPVRADDNDNGDGPPVCTRLGSLPDYDEDCDGHLAPAGAHAPRPADLDDLGCFVIRPHDPRYPIAPGWWTRHPVGHVIEELGNFGSLYCVACRACVYTSRGRVLDEGLSRDEPCPARVKPDCDGADPAQDPRWAE